MKQKGIKWITGLSGVLLFSGFIGYFSQASSEDAGGVNVAAPSSPNLGQQKESDSVEQQWNNESGTSQDSNGIAQKEDDNDSDISAGNDDNDRDNSISRESDDNSGSSNESSAISTPDRSSVQVSGRQRGFRTRAS